MKKNGFTLIELLVVIAIIGILSSIATVSLKDARMRAYDASIKSDISHIRTSIEICVDNFEGVYTNCDSVPVQFVPPACSVDLDYIVKAEYQGYVVSADLCHEDGDFCADSEGFAGVVSAREEDDTTPCLLELWP